MNFVNKNCVLNFDNGKSLCPKTLKSKSTSPINTDKPLTVLYANLGGNLKRLETNSEPIFKIIKKSNPDILKNSSQ